MTSESADSVWTPLSLADLVNRDAGLLTQVEGVLLAAAGKDTTLSPVGLARETDVDEEVATDLFRHLEQTSVLDRDSFGGSIADSQYAVDADRCREVLTAARHAGKAITAFESQSPAKTTVRPLVTFPADPSFRDISPSDFSMSWLMPTLTGEIKQCSESIVLLSPFFEREGFEYLQDVLIAALDRGVQVTIVSRYLGDQESYNRQILSDFTDNVEDDGVSTENLHLIDYTGWSEETPDEARRQGGDNPAFTLHAKVMAFDVSSVYIGSANVTDYGFEHYLETGVLIQGPEVTDFRKLIEFLLESTGSQEIQMG